MAWSIDKVVVKLMFPIYKYRFTSLFLTIILLFCNSCSHDFQVVEIRTIMFTSHDIQRKQTNNINAMVVDSQRDDSTTLKLFLKEI